MITKLNRTLIKITILLLLFVPPVAIAQSPVIIEPALQDQNIEQVIARIVDIIFQFGLLLAPLLMIWGVFLAVTASGNADQVSRAKNVIIWTLVGLVILLLSKGIIDLVEGILGI